MGWMPGCPQDPGVYHGPLDPQAIVLHRTYGAWGGDYSVGKQGIFHFLLGKDEGRWVQFAPTEIVQYHCNGANFRAVGIEIEGTNDDPLTGWQSARLGELLHWLHAEHGIPLDYLDPGSVPAASVSVNHSNFVGVISHVSVQTDDGSSQHTDEISVAAFNAAVGGAPTPGDDDMTPTEFEEYFLKDKPFGVSRIGAAVGDEVAQSVEKYLFEDKPFGVTRFEAYLKEALKTVK